jgi:hypothetical protein
MAERRKVLVVGAVALFVAIAVIIAVDYLERQAEDAGYVVTPRGDEPLEFAEGVNPYAPDIPADYEGEISDERLREYVQEIEDYYSGSNNREGVEYMITEVAIIAKNAEPCANLKTQDIKDSCYYGVALEALDPSPCANVIFGRADCYMIIAEQTGDETLCEKANYEYEVCLEAARTKDMSTARLFRDAATTRLKAAVTLRSQSRRGISKNVIICPITRGHATTAWLPTTKSLRCAQRPLKI